MGRLKIMMLEIGALIIISFVIRLIFSALEVQESAFTQWFPILAALVIVYTLRFRLRKKISSMKEDKLSKKE